jgi:UDP-N-acetyl-D-glucosamine dehydrogenase
MSSAPLDHLSEYDAAAIVADHSTYDYPAIVEQAQLVVDTRNATKGIESPKVVRCRPRDGSCADRVSWWVRL